jgi:hypothetical protein
MSKQNRSFMRLKASDPSWLTCLPDSVYSVSNTNSSL